MRSVTTSRLALALGIWATFAPPGAERLLAQQISDDAFRFPNPHPAYAPGSGPVVCIDEAHHNFHTADGRYRPFADLLRTDGYSVLGYDGPLSRESLAECSLLVIANALAQANDSDWTYPHGSAFTAREIRELMAWVRGGGRLLVFADHAPMAGAARDLGAVFGLIMIDAYVDAKPGPDYFSKADGTLGSHPIVSGREAAEAVDSLLTFTGQAFRLTRGWDPLLALGPEARAWIHPRQAFREGGPGDRAFFSVAGWHQGAARQWDEGRAVFLGEAAMCSAQLGGPERNPMGMNDPRAPRNPQFCLNVVRWLTGAIESKTSEDLPKLAFSESDGCADIRVVATNSDGTEALVIDVDVRALGIGRGDERLFDLAEPPVGVEVVLEVYAEPPLSPMYCVDFLVETGPPVQWRPVGGTLTVELRDSNERAGTYEAIVGIRDLVLENGTGRRVEADEPIEIVATVGWLAG